MKTETKAVTALQAVNLEILSHELSDKDAGLMAMGAFEADQFHHQFSELTLATRLTQIKEAKSYRALGFKTWESFVGAKCKCSLATADRMVSELQKLGTEWFRLREITRISRAVFAAVNPEFKDGHVLIEGEKFKLTPANATAIQDAFQRCQTAMREARASASESKADAEKARSERDNAKKAAIEARRKMLEALSPTAFADADEDHQVLLNVQSRVDAAMVMLRKLSERELSEDNRARLIGLVKYLHCELLRAIDEETVSYSTIFDPHDPSGALYVDSQSDQGRNLVMEFSAALGGKR